MPVTRRQFIAGLVVGGAAAAIGVPYALGAAGSTSTGRYLPSLAPLPDPFTQQLRIPPVLAPVRSDSNGDHYEITQRVATAEILPGVSTTIWGYNGIFPGPTIESRSGQQISVTHINELPVPTVVHLHGGRTPPEHDGYPIDFVLPVDREVPLPFYATESGDLSKGRRVHWYPLEQPATTLWYHDHRMDFTGPGVWKGLAGFHMVRDDEEEALGLPSATRELPLMIVDRSFDADGSLLYPAIDPTGLVDVGVTEGFEAGVLGDVNLVNGVPWPVVNVDGARYRLRFLNAANARRYDLRLDPPPPGGFVQIGTDGGLLAQPFHHDHIEMAPAQRFDVIVDFSAYQPGTIVTLVNDFDIGRMGLVMRFIVGARAEDNSRIPDRLTTIEPLDTTSEGVITRTMRFDSGHLISNDR
ncbi:MAG: multicopper oxidase family protein, partial [Acidimicrobiia bacterium]